MLWEKIFLFFIFSFALEHNPTKCNFNFKLRHIFTPIVISISDYDIFTFYLSY